MSAIAVFKEPSPTMRVLGSAFYVVPGALLVANASGWIGAALVQGEEPSLIALALLPALLGGILLALGTEATDKPLFMAVLLPMPMLMSMGYQMHDAGIGGAGEVALGGILLPMIGCPLVSRYYRNRAKKAAARTVFPAKASFEPTPPPTQPLNP
jgi:hypothetical protein